MSENPVVYIAMKSTVKENVTIRLENAVQALQNLSPFVSDANSEAVLEMTRNFQWMFWNCY